MNSIKGNDKKKKIDLNLLTIFSRQFWQAIYLYVIFKWSKSSWYSEIQVVPRKAKNACESFDWTNAVLRRKTFQWGHLTFDLDSLNLWISTVNIINFFIKNISRSTWKSFRLHQHLFLLRRYGGGIVWICIVLYELVWAENRSMFMKVQV